jgi:large subunit ribosomal protein L21e
MVVKSHGPRRRTREKFRRSIKAPINEYLRKFEVGDKVVIDINSASQKGMPFKRFQGLSGEIVQKRGRAYILKVKSGDALKTIVSNPEHIKKM